jgi:hypothetical protein
VAPAWEMAGTLDRPAQMGESREDPNWNNAMREEFHALMNQRNCDLVPCLVGVNIVIGKLIFHHKFNSDGSLAPYKVMWVVRGFT